MASKITKLKLQLHDAIYRLRLYSNSLIHILSLSNSHNNVASIQKNRGDKSHRVIVALAIQDFSVKDTSRRRFGMYLNHNNKSLFGNFQSDNNEIVQKYADCFDTERICWYGQPAQRMPKCCCTFLFQWIR